MVKTIIMNTDKNEVVVATAIECLLNKNKKDFTKNFSRWLKVLEHTIYVFKEGMVYENNNNKN